MHQTHSLHIRKAHMSSVEFDSDPRLAGNETGGWGVSQPLAFVNCMSHIILAGTVNWKRSRGFAVLMSFQWTQVILWIPEEPFLFPTFTDPSVRAKLFIFEAICGCGQLLPHLLFLIASARRGIDVYYKHCTVLAEIISCSSLSLCHCAFNVYYVVFQGVICLLILHSPVMNYMSL